MTKKDTLGTQGEHTPEGASDFPDTIETGNEAQIIARQVADALGIPVDGMASIIDTLHPDQRADLLAVLDNPRVRVDQDLMILKPEKHNICTDQGTPELSTNDLEIEALMDGIREKGFGDELDALLASFPDFKTKK